MSYDSVKIEFDSTEAVKAIQDSSPTSSNFALIRRIQYLLMNVRSWVINHLPRERNKTIYCLAKKALVTNQ
ncbi:hypothetical protein Gogos_003753 [Gossypium gossypioides]|uniref:RNase H type-1 domain-containing protein n=1 Tax=Gossypium gossypioides TaxID=34282 RepID=A0A7J9CN62_GOSGO|nr:hypothetical protein [Gossypium gossypioides]